MKIKNILAILSLGMVSCVGLEQYPTTSYTDETFWTIEDNVRTALYLGYNQCWHQDYYFAIPVTMLVSFVEWRLPYTSSDSRLLAK